MQNSKIYKYWNNFWFKPRPAERLAISRIIFYVFFFLFLRNVPRLPVIEYGNPLAPSWQPLGFFRVLHIPAPAFSMEAFLCMNLIWKVAILFSAFGFFTTLNTKIVFFLGYYLIGLQYNYGNLDHSTQLPLVIAGIFAFSSCGDAFAMDQLVNKCRLKNSDKESRIDSGAYFWPIKLSQTYIMVIYFQAAWQKIRNAGVNWALSDNFRIMLLTRPNLTHAGYYISAHPMLCRFLATVTLAFQFLSISAVFSRRMAVILVPFLFLFHICTALLMGGGAAFLPYDIAYVLWVPWDRLIPRNLTIEPDLMIAN